MIRVDDLQARAGQPIAPLWQQLRQRLAAAGQLQLGTGMRLHQGPDGTTVIAEPSGKSFTPHFKVSLSGMEASVGLGTVNGDVPTIQGIGLDGVNSSGATVTVPRVKLTTPDDLLRSWIVLQVKIDLATGLIVEEPDAITLIHTNDRRSNIDPALGWQPVALLTWADRRTPRRAHQIVMKDLNHVWREPAAQGRQGRHFFGSV